MDPFAKYVLHSQSSQFVQEYPMVDFVKGVGKVYINYVTFVAILNVFEYSDIM